MTKPRAYSYTRFSTPEQIRGRSLDRQMEAARAYAAAHGMTLDEELRDLGRSAFHGAHRAEGTALGGFLAAIHAGEVPPGSVLIVESLDRLSRQQITTALGQFLAILGAGVTIATLADNQTYTPESVNEGPAPLVMSLMVMGRAHEESLRKSERVGDAWAKKKARAAETREPMTARVPGWLCLSADRRRIEVIPDRAAVIRRIFDDSLAGIGTLTIMRRLNQDGVPTFGRSQIWHDSYIKKILGNEAVCGTFQAFSKERGDRRPVGPSVPGYYPQVIPPEDFARVQAGLSSRRTAPIGRAAASYSNLLSSVARCGCCGAPMRLLDKGKPPKGGRYYQCDTARRYADGCELRRLFPASEAEAGVVASLRTTDIGRLLDGEKVAAARAAAELEVIEARIKSALTKQKRLMRIGGDDDDVDDAVDEALRKLRREIAGLRREHSAMRELAAAAAATASDSPEDIGRVVDYLDGIDTMDAPERYRARAALAQTIRRLVERVEFRDPGVVEVFLVGATDRDARELVILDNDVLIFEQDVADTRNAEVPNNEARKPRLPSII